MLTAWAQREVLNYLLTGEPLEARPSAWFVALHTGNPGAGGDNEVTTSVDPEYARQAVTFEVTPEGIRYNAASLQDVTFGPAGAGANYTAVYVSVWGADTEGNALVTSPLPIPIPVTEGGMVTIPLGEILVEGGV